MLITTAHLLALEELVNREAAGHDALPLAEDDPQEYIYRELELQGLMRLVIPRAYGFAYAGREALELIKAMREAKVIPPIDQLESSWRFLGSDIVAALYAARQKKDQVGSPAQDMLSTRGFTENMRNVIERRTLVRLNRFGDSWMDFAERHRPRLEITGDLANSIHHMQPGYTGRPGLTMPPEHIMELESLDLLVWSVPDRITWALTKLGLAVYDTLRKGGYAGSDVVLDEPILALLARLADEGSKALTPEQLVDLQLPGYVDANEQLSAAGHAAMGAYKLLQQEHPGLPHSFAITEPEFELLETVKKIEVLRSDKHDIRPDKKTLHRMLIDRMSKHYEEFEGRSGRMLKERSPKKRKALALLPEMKDLDKWFSTFWDIDEIIYSLEAFELLHEDIEENTSVYLLTPNGRRVLAERDVTAPNITSTAVKVLTFAATRFHAPADSWVELATDEGLIGSTGGATKAGRLYVYLSESSKRWLALTCDEGELLTNLPDLVKETHAPGSRKDATIEEEKQDWAMEKLEARGMIERLVDDQAVRTEVGRLVQSALSGTARKLGHPVTPTIIRLLEAIRAVGTLYVKEFRVRLQPHQWTEVERLMGIGPEEFKDVITLARVAQYIGENNINDAGMNLLEAQEKLNRRPGYKPARP